MSQARPTFKPHYDNFIGGKFVAPIGGEYFENISPIDGKAFTKAARSGKEDIELALDAAHAAFATWSKTSAAYRAGILNKIADAMEANLQLLATIETIDNGKPIRECVNVDLPLCIDHFRYFAGVIRAEEGSIAEHDENTVSIIVNEPIGVVGQIIPWNFPLLMATWKIAPALAAAGFTIDFSDAGLYLWATRNEDCWESVSWLAQLGILATPGIFYGEKGARHIRIAMTATDQQIEDAASRILNTLQG